MWPCGVVGDALASSKRRAKSTGFLLSAYTAAEVLSAESKAQLAGERDVIGREAADVRVAIEASQNAIRRLTELYGDGVINSTVTGIVGSLHLSEGSVVREAEPLMEIFTARHSSWRTFRKAPFTMFKRVIASASVSLLRATMATSVRRTIWPDDYRKNSSRPFSR
jgi:hypothetical protein